MSSKGKLQNCGAGRTASNWISHHRRNTINKLLGQEQQRTHRIQPSDAGQASLVRDYSGMKTACLRKKWEKNKSKGNKQTFSPLGRSSARQQEERVCCSSAEKLMLSRRPRCIERVVKHDIRAGAPHWEGCQLLPPASFTSPAAVKDGFSWLERSWELLSEQTTRFIADHPLLKCFRFCCLPGKY